MAQHARVCMYACVHALRLHAYEMYAYLCVRIWLHAKRPSVYVGGVRVRGKRKR